MQGVSCHHCHDSLSEEQKARFLEREKQIRLSKERGQAHIGSDALTQLEENRAKKQAIKKQQRTSN